MEKKFRAHHILCTSLYEGKGYSGTFCENMTKIVENLREDPDQTVLLVAEPDRICANCPNRTGTNECAQDANHVEIKDRKLLESLGLTEGASYSYRNLCRTAQKKVTREAFEATCGKCYWHRQGLCRYEDLIAQLKTIIEK